MINVDDFTIFVYREKIDFRKSISGLSAIVRYEMNLDPFKKSLFIFRNERRDKIKILYWNETGFALWYMVLEKEKFPWPVAHEDKTVVISNSQLRWLLRGIDYWGVKPHQKITYKHLS